MKRRKIEDAFDLFEREMRRQIRLMKRLMEGAYKNINEGFGFEYEEPLMDLIDEGDKYAIELDLPGVDKKDIDISVVDHSLKITAKRKVENKEKGEDYIRAERISSGYQRIISLPEDVDMDNIKAKYENGVLRIEIGKKPGSTGKKINIE
ncbi:MAG: Hsp20/alpha crystallin family protein [Nanopusillaceae archaeon]|jgi:HSP20 family protein